MAPISSDSSCAQVADLERGDLAVLVLVDDERVDDLDELVLAQPVELGCDLAGEVGLGEAEHQHLYGANGHSALLLRSRS